MRSSRRRRTTRSRSCSSPDVPSRVWYGVSRRDRGPQRHFPRAVAYREPVSDSVRSGPNLRRAAGHRPSSLLVGPVGDSGGSAAGAPVRSHQFRSAGCGGPRLFAVHPDELHLAARPAAPTAAAPTAGLPQLRPPTRHPGNHPLAFLLVVPPRLLAVTRLTNALEPGRLRRIAGELREPQLPSAARAPLRPIPGGRAGGEPRERDADCRESHPRV
jgi:hypothetical protein